MKRIFFYLLIVFQLINISCQKRPEAFFTSSKTSVVTGEEIIFSNSSVNAFSYEWDFGDHQTSTLQNPVHSYSQQGNYNVTLTVFSKNGKKKDSATQNISVINETMTDIDGNVYNTVRIGTQQWMSENLKTKKLSNGVSINHSSSYSQWYLQTQPAYCFYNNDEVTNKPKYGAIYNWYAVNTGNLCPQGWRVPSMDDWETLFNYVGGASVAGGKLKETSTEYWNAPNTGATNEVGFSARAGGYRAFDSAIFLNEKTFCYWWASDQGSYINHSWSVRLSHTIQSVDTYECNKNNGVYVRCVKN